MSNVRETPLILSQPFLETTQANINVANGIITLMVDDKEMVFDFYGVPLLPFQLMSKPAFRSTLLKT